MDTKRIREAIGKTDPATTPEVECQVCGFTSTNMLQHLLNAECGVDLYTYVERYPSSPIATVEGYKQIIDSLDHIDSGRRRYSVQKTFGVKFDKVAHVNGLIKPNDHTPRLLPYYKFRPDLTKFVLYALEENEPLYLFGPSGSGKTSVVEQIAARLNRGAIRVNHDSDIGRADIIGQWVLTGKDSMEFREGLLPQAMREGHIYIADEFDVIDPAVAMLYQAVLEKKPLTIFETNSVIHPHPDFRFIATGNTSGSGDMSGQFHGTRPMNEATMQRFMLFVEVNYPTFDEEYDILKGVCGIDDPDIRKKMIEVAGLVRKAFMEDKISVTFSTRTLINIADKLISFGSLKVAYALGILNRLNDIDAEVVNQTINTVWGRVAND